MYSTIDKEFLVLQRAFRPYQTSGLGEFGELSGLGEFGNALGEISAVDSYIYSEFAALQNESLGELREIGDIVADAKKALSSALDIGSKIQAVKSRFQSAESKIARMRNRQVASRLLSTISSLKSQLSKAEGINSQIQGAVQGLKDIISKAVKAVEDTKKKVVETAKKARERALDLARKAKEKALELARKVKEKATAAAKMAKEAIVRKAAEVKAKAVRAAQIAKQTAQRAAAVVRQKAVQAKATAQRIATQTRAAASRAVQPVKQVAQRAVQTVRKAISAPRVVASKAVSTAKKFFGFRGIHGLGLAPLAIAALVASAGALVGYIASQLSKVESEITSEEVPTEIKVDATTFNAKLDECKKSAMLQDPRFLKPENQELLDRTCRQRVSATLVPSEILVELPVLETKEPPYVTGEEVTEEYDPNRGYWTKSEEGDIIRPGGQRGYWSEEPPRAEFRAERRAKLTKRVSKPKPALVDEFEDTFTPKTRQPITRETYVPPERETVSFEPEELYPTETEEEYVPGEEYEEEPEEYIEGEEEPEEEYTEEETIEGIKKMSFKSRIMKALKEVGL